MPRGGKRNNAGRKPVLDQMERWDVGSRCEELWRAEWDAAKQAAMAAATANVSVLYEIANAVPIPERETWIRLNRTHFENHRRSHAQRTKELPMVANHRVVFRSLHDAPKARRQRLRSESQERNR